MSRSVADRFGRAGFRVALVARTRPKLEKYVQELAADGVEAAAFTADVTDGAELVRVIGEIEQRFGHIDVAAYSPGNLDAPPVNVLDLDPDAMGPALHVALWGPMRLVRALLPGMIDRGDGAFLLASGGSVIRPLPMLGNSGVALGGLRQYAHNLTVALEGKGVYVGLLHINGPIDRSDLTKMFPPEVIAEHGIIDPDEIAEIAWTMYVKRDRVEQLIEPAKTLA
jgi:NAD(P)-dependent dehydrogenase (short-subunit alcohol dehydrogenase family)